MSRVPAIVTLCATVLLAACATEPMGPTARVMPASGKQFETFAQDQAMCEQFANGETEGGASMSNFKQLAAAAVTTALGAGLGAAVHGGHGAQLGAALGGIAGGVLSGRGSARDQNSLQGRYDLAYTQCMVARGNQVGGMARAAAMQPPGYGPGYPSGYPPGPGAPSFR